MNSPEAPNGLPLEQVVKRLHGVAAHFWTRPETADCTIVVPVPVAALPRPGRSMSAASPWAESSASASTSSVCRASSPLARRPQAHLASPGPGSRIFDKRSLNRIPVAPAPHASAADVTESSSDSSRGSWSSSERASSVSSRSYARSSYAPTSATLSSPRTAPGAELKDERSAPPSPAGNVSAPQRWSSLAQLVESRRGSAPAPIRRPPASQDGLGKAGDRAPFGSPATASVDGPSGSLAKSADEGRHLVFRLHRDYLVSQSSLLRSWFGEAGPVADRKLISPSSSPASPSLSQFSSPSASPSPANEPDRRAASVSPATTGKGPRLLSNQAGKPTLYLPLPDPSSFPALLHYLYHGDFTVLATAMDRGTVRWEGIVLNADYLGLAQSLKDELGMWWNQRRRRAAHLMRARSGTGSSGGGGSPFHNFRFGSSVFGREVAAASEEVVNGQDGKRRRDGMGEVGLGCPSPRTLVRPSHETGGHDERRRPSYLSSDGMALDSGSVRSASPCDPVRRMRQMHLRKAETRPGPVSKVVARGRSRAFTVLINSLGEKGREGPSRSLGRLRSSTIGERMAVPAKESSPLPL